MAKMFYTLEEACEKLALGEDEVKQLVQSGQLQEFRDRDQLMFKVEQVDLLATTEEEEDIGLAEASGSGMIPLSDSGGSSMSESGTGLGVENPKEQTGISIFDADELEEADPSAVTQVTEESPLEFSMEGSSGGSGSGLMDLTQEADDTSLGIEELPSGDAYAGDEEETVGGTVVEGGESGLFESTESEADLGAPAAGPAMIAAEPFDGGWSGVTGGLALGLAIAAGFATVLIVFTMTGAGQGLLGTVADKYWMVLGGLGGAMAVMAVVGWLLGRKSG